MVTRVLLVLAGFETLLELFGRNALAYGCNRFFFYNYWQTQPGVVTRQAMDFYDRTGTKTRGTGGWDCCTFGKKGNGQEPIRRLGHFVESDF